MATATTGFGAAVAEVARAAERAGVFGAVETRSLPTGPVLECRAKASAAPAFYRVYPEGGKLWVSLVTADRWLSESIESDLMHTGDKLEELIEEELEELGYDGPTPTYQHYRSDDKLFTFRTPIPVQAGEEGSVRGTETIVLFLRAYEQCFRQLGDIEAEPE